MAAFVAVKVDDRSVAWTLYQKINKGWPRPQSRSQSHLHVKLFLGLLSCPGVLFSCWRMVSREEGPRYISPPGWLVGRGPVWVHSKASRLMKPKLLAAYQGSFIDFHCHPSSCHLQLPLTLERQDIGQTPDSSLSVLYYPVAGTEWLETLTKPPSPHRYLFTHLSPPGCCHTRGPGIETCHLALSGHYIACLSRSGALLTVPSLGLLRLK